MDRLQTLVQRLEATKTNTSNYEKLRDTLVSFPDELYRHVRIPVAGFEVEGVVENTNKIITLVGDGWLMEKSAREALRVVDERLAVLEKNQRAYEDAIETAKIEKEGLPVFEIKETLDDNGVEISSTMEEYDTGKAANLNKAIHEIQNGASRQIEEISQTEEDYAMEGIEEDPVEDEDNDNDDDMMDGIEHTGDDFDDTGDLPLMEIREELDEDGNVIEGTVEPHGEREAVDFEKHLKALNELAQKKLDQKAKEDQEASAKEKEIPKEQTKPVYGPPPPPKKVSGGIFKPEVTKAPGSETVANHHKPEVLRTKSPKIEEITEEQEDEEEKNKTQTMAEEYSNPAVVNEVVENDINSSTDSLDSIPSASSDSSVSSIPNPALATESLLELELLADDIIDEEELGDEDFGTDDWDYEEDEEEVEDPDEDEHGRTRGSMFPGMSPAQLQAIIEGRKAQEAKDKETAVAEEDATAVSVIKSALKSDKSGKSKSVSFSNNLHIKRIPNKETIKIQERQEMQQQKKLTRILQNLGTQPSKDEDEDEDLTPVASIPTVSDIAEREGPSEPIAEAPKKVSRFMMARKGKEVEARSRRGPSQESQANPGDGRIVSGAPDLTGNSFKVDELKTIPVTDLDKDITDYKESMKKRSSSHGHGHSHGHTRSPAVTEPIITEPVSTPSPKVASPEISRPIITTAKPSGLAAPGSSTAPAISEKDKDHDDEIMKMVMGYLAENEDENEFEQLHQEMDESRLAEELYKQRAQNHNNAVTLGLQDRDNIEDFDEEMDEDDDNLHDDIADATQTVEEENDENNQVMTDIVEHEAEAPDMTYEEDLGMDPAVHRREVAEQYYRLRNKMVAKGGGFKQTDEEKAVEDCDEDAAPIKVSRFRAARMKQK